MPSVKRDPPAHEFMRSDVIAVKDTDAVWDVARLFAEHEISGAPVLNAEGELVGVVSQTDIVRHLEEVAASFTNGEFYADAEDERRRPRRPIVTAGDLMNPEAITADRDTKASSLSRLMLGKRIHRIIITEGRKLCGIVTTLDLLKVL
ncbi:MAG: CBS domain-containing protein [Elusimicrobia bacterium]|nr:CBS domain-containing protein [Elusimicrobiota bacterium]